MIVFQRRMHQHVKTSEIDDIFGMNNCDIQVNMLIITAKEVNYTKRIVPQLLAFHQSEASKSVGL